MRLIDLLRETLLEAKAKIKLHKSSKEGPIRPATKEALKNSIENRWLLNIYYEGDEENSPGYRWIEPFVWGIHHTSGNNVLRAWQYRGQTLTPDNFPYWRMFRLDRIRSTAPLTNAVFNKPRPEYNPDDKQMSKIIERVNFDKEPPTEKGTEPPVDINSPEIKKTAGIIRSNTHDNKVDFERLEKSPEFRDSKMKRALQVLKHIILKAGKGILKGLQNLHLKEDIDETN